MFGLSIHLDIELSQVGEGKVVNLVILVAKDMFKVDSDGEFVFKHFDGSEKISMLDGERTLAPVPLTMMDAILAVATQLNAALHDAMEVTEGQES